MQRLQFVYLSESNYPLGIFHPSNHNFKLILNNDIGYYVGSYSTKVQKESSESISKTYQQISDVLISKKIDPLEKDLNRQKTKTGLSIVCQLLQKQLKLCCIGAAMAAYVMLYDTRFHFSCPFSICVLYLYLQYLLKPSFVFVRISETGRLSENITEYSNRHQDLEWCSLWDWKKSFSVKALNRIKKSESALQVMIDNDGRHPNGLYFLFLSDYKKYNTHVIVLNSTKHVPIIITNQLPDFDTIYEGYENSKDFHKNNVNHLARLNQRRQYYAQFVNIIFFPWRNILNFSNQKPEEIDWW